MKRLGRTYQTNLLREAFPRAEYTTYNAWTEDTRNFERYFFYNADNVTTVTFSRESSTRLIGVVFSTRSRENPGNDYQLIEHTLLNADDIDDDIVRMLQIHLVYLHRGVTHWES